MVESPVWPTLRLLITHKYVKMSQLPSSGGAASWRATKIKYLFLTWSGLIIPRQEDENGEVMWPGNEVETV